MGCKKRTRKIKIKIKIKYELSSILIERSESKRERLKEVRAQRIERDVSRHRKT